MTDFYLASLSLIVSTGKGAKGLARSGFPLLGNPQNGSSDSCAAITALCCPCLLALPPPGLDTRLGSQRAVPEPVGLVYTIEK